jgi:two-component system, LytTR family, response regulator
MYTCIIVDDQPEAVGLIKDHVSKVPQLSVLLMSTDSIEALTFLDKTKPDIIFLDIEMPGMSGIEFIENIKAKWGNNMPKVVFITGNCEYALSGYEYGVVDYLLKPISFVRFKKCIDRIIDDLDKRNTPAERPNFFFVEDNGKKVKINFDDIIYIEGAGNYIIIVTGEIKIVIYRTMNALQELLPDNKFMRVHKSYILAINKVQAIRGNELMISVKNTEMNIPIGVTYKENVMKQLGLN